MAKTHISIQMDPSPFIYSNSFNPMKQNLPDESNCKLFAIFPIPYFHPLRYKWKQFLQHIIWQPMKSYFYDITLKVFETRLLFRFIDTNVFFQSHKRQKRRFSTKNFNLYYAKIRLPIFDTDMRVAAFYWDAINTDLESKPFFNIFLAFVMYIFKN